LIQFKSSSSRYPELFAYPVLFSLAASPITNRQLTDIVLGHLLRRFAGLQVEDIAVDMRSKLFVFRAVNAHGTACTRCSDYNCVGCPLPENDDIFTLEVLGCEWTTAALQHFDGKRTEAKAHQSLLEYQEDSKRSIPLADCFSLFAREEKLSAEDAWYCGNCKTHREAHKKFDLGRLPELLVVHLKRFQYSRYWRDKIELVVDFPLEGLDLSPWYVAGGAPPLYDLFAVSNHIGSMGGGHYTASVLGPDGKWWNCNDSYASPLSDRKDVICPEAYLLFYKRRDAAVPLVPPSALLPPTDGGATATTASAPPAAAVPQTHDEHRASNGSSASTGAASTISTPPSVDDRPMSIADQPD